MDQALLDVIIESVQLHLQRLQALLRNDEHRERVEELVAIQEERRRRLIEATRRN